MISPVHILVTVKKPEQLTKALLVFETLRVGFPSAFVYVWGNGLAPDAARATAQAASLLGSAQFHNLAPVQHDEFVQQLVLNQAQPFWLVDPDVVFFGEMETACDSDDLDVLAGRLEPEHVNPYTQAVHASRLHPCVLWVNPGAIRGQLIRHARECLPSHLASASVPWIKQHWVPRRDCLPLFYDTMAGVWHALGGREFNERLNEQFEHLYAGTYAEELAVCPAFKDLPAQHAAIVADPQKAYGIHEQQKLFYQNHQVKGAI